MSAYDLLIGINEGRLDVIMSQVYASPALRKSLFSGTQTGSYTGINFTVTWSLGAAPTISLRSPTPTEWTESIQAGGSPVAPQSGAFIVNLSSLSVKLVASGETVDTTVPVKAICTVATHGSALSIAALSVIVNLSNSSPLDKYMISNVLVPNILAMLSKALSAIHIPNLSFAGISLTPPVVEILNGYLLTAFNLVQDGTPSIGSVPIPTGDPFFALLSRQLTQSVVDYEVRTNLQGQQFHKNGSEGGGGFSADYSAVGAIASISASTTSNPQKLHVNVSLNMSASAGISTPIDAIIGGLETAGKAIINPDTWNPTKW